MKDSTIVELSEDMLCMRALEDPTKWPLEASQLLLASTLKVDVPEFVPGQAYQLPPAMQQTGGYLSLIK